MTLYKKDILQHITDSMDQEELIDRLGISMESLVQILSSDIMRSLDSFSDIYYEDDESE